MVKEKTKGKKRTAGKRELKWTASQYEVVCDDHTVLDVFHSRE